MLTPATRHTLTKSIFVFSSFCACQRGPRGPSTPLTQFYSGTAIHNDQAPRPLCSRPPSTPLTKFYWPSQVTVKGEASPRLDQASNHPKPAEPRSFKKRTPKEAWRQRDKRSRGQNALFFGPCGHPQPPGKAGAEGGLRKTSAVPTSDEGLPTDSRKQ
jgi:hypothetical protein